jgi:hypothetical protein
MRELRVGRRAVHDCVPSPRWFPHGLVPEFPRSTNVKVGDMFRMPAGSININATRFDGGIDDVVPKSIA